MEYFKALNILFGFVLTRNLLYLQHEAVFSCFFFNNSLASLGNTIANRLVCVVGINAFLKKHNPAIPSSKNAVFSQKRLIAVLGADKSQPKVFVITKKEILYLKYFVTLQHWLQDNKNAKFIKKLINLLKNCFAIKNSSCVYGQTQRLVSVFR